VEGRWMVAWNFRKAGLFSHTVRGNLSVFSPKLSDESPGRLPIVTTAANSPCDTWRGGSNRKSWAGAFRAFPGWHTSCAR
jgi:hypothetical protein